VESNLIFTKSAKIIYIFTKKKLLQKVCALKLTLIKIEDFFHIKLHELKSDKPLLAVRKSKIFFTGKNTLNEIHLKVLKMEIVLKNFFKVENLLFTIKVKNLRKLDGF